MPIPARPAALALAALTVAWTGDLEHPAASAPGLTGTLKRAAATRDAPAWLAAAVCARAPELAEGCAPVAGAISEEATQARLDPLRVLAIVEVESGWDPLAVSSRGARGLMQLRRPTLAREARRSRLASSEPHDPVANVRAGIRYYARLVRVFGDPDLALVAYNAGPNRLLAHLRAGKGVPARLLDYPRRVRAAERRLRDALGRPDAILALGGPAHARPD
ncbi:MAG TPA: transglycosylase SLT domain-containing protein [Anaeromyxobacter sp.]|nr:transglycosylase SLT domain-containing protein [Anaeromyxobacter sp.]